MKQGVSLHHLQYSSNALPILGFPALLRCYHATKAALLSRRISHTSGVARGVMGFFERFAYARQDGMLNMKHCGVSHGYDGVLCARACHARRLCVEQVEQGGAAQLPVGRLRRDGRRQAERGQRRLHVVPHRLRAVGRQAVSKTFARMQDGSLVSRKPAREPYIRTEQDTAGPVVVAVPCRRSRHCRCMQGGNVQQT